MKQINQLKNHEVWHTCINCGERFDRRQQSDVCPVCQTVARSYYAGILGFGFLIFWILVILAFCGCRQTTFAIRGHKNRVLQEVIQYQSSVNSRDDWTRVYRNQDRRPHGSWPFEWLQ